MLNTVLVVAGTLSLALGILGVFVPLLPTTPFLLLAAACYARGSTRFYRWLMDHRHLGPYIRDYREGRGIPLGTKVGAILLLWATILYSIVVVVDHVAIRIVLLVIAAGVTVHLLSLPTRPSGRHSGAKVLPPEPETPPAISTDSE